MTFVTAGYPNLAETVGILKAMQEGGANIIELGESHNIGVFNSLTVIGLPFTDPLADGRLRLRRKANSTDEGRLQVALRGAAVNVSYEVFFWPAASSKSRESLGIIGPTNADGNLNALTPSAISGMNRIGVFVVVRHDGSEAGKDEFISSMGG